MGPATGHRHKRQNNQPSITAFFNPNASSPTGQNHDRQAQTPPLPQHVQSSLLNVGMRVRKSVPEGYKNKAADDLPAPTVTRRTASNTRRSELQPFCGLHKTGGILYQEGVMGPADGAVRPVGAHDGFPAEAFSSQSTMGSQQSFDGDGLRALMPSAYGSGNKRALDEEDLDDDELLDEMDAEAASVERVYAQPRGKGRSRGVVAGFNVPDDGVDFGEAEFLRPGEEMEL